MAIDFRIRFHLTLPIWYKIIQPFPHKWYRKLYTALLVLYWNRWQIFPSYRSIYATLLFTLVFTSGGMLSIHFPSSSSSTLTCLFVSFRSVYCCKTYGEEWTKEREGYKSQYVSSNKFRFCGIYNHTPLEFPSSSSFWSSTRYFVYFHFRFYIISFLFVNHLFIISFGLDIAKVRLPISRNICDRFKFLLFWFWFCACDHWRWTKIHTWFH